MGDQYNNFSFIVEQVRANPTVMEIRNFFVMTNSDNL